MRSRATISNPMPQKRARLDTGVCRTSAGPTPKTSRLHARASPEASPCSGKKRGDDREGARKRTSVGRKAELWKTRGDRRRPIKIRAGRGWSSEQEVTITTLQLTQADSRCSSRCRVSYKPYSSAPPRTNPRSGVFTTAEKV